MIKQIIFQIFFSPIVYRNLHTHSYIYWWNYKYALKF